MSNSTKTRGPKAHAREASELEQREGDHQALVRDTKLEILPHPLAPLYDAPDWPARLADAAREMQSLTLGSGNEEIRQLLRQTGFVSFWFLMKFVLAYTGPYDLVNDMLHLDMANFYQRTFVPGTRALMLIGRGMYKSTIFSHGGETYNLLRNPEISSAIGSAVADRAKEFFLQVKSNFEDNELMAWLYPEYVPQRGADRWKDTEIVLPCRHKKRPEPSLRPFSAGGSTQGIHADSILLDDIVGLDQLNSQYQASAEMHQMTKWLKASIRPLLKRPKDGIIRLVGTRYAVDDPYEYALGSVREMWGYWEGLPYEIAPGGTWKVWYRTATEEGEPVFPEALSLSDIEAMKTEDWWTWATQYENNPYAAGTAELGEYALPTAQLEYDPNERDYRIGWNDRPSREWRELWLSECDLVQQVDPAATERGATAKTSRTALVVLARTPKFDGYGPRRIVLWVQRGYVSSTTMFDWMFTQKDKWKAKSRELLRVSGLEAQGAFKILVSPLREEERRRGTSLRLREIKTTTDKDARIRTTLQPLLENGLLYALQGPTHAHVEEELRVFPTGSKKDVIDALSMADALSMTPPWMGDEVGDEDDERGLARVGESDRNPVTGY